MSSHPHKAAQKMCKSPKSSSFHNVKGEKVQIINEYENMSTNCTVIGSNNLHLVKKPQIVTSMSPAYSNPSPGYPPSPYSSPASLKSPSPQSLKPPTPQPNVPVMQIIHNNHSFLARPIQTSQPQNVVKLKPHLNILPKPAASPQPSPKPSVSPQIMIPTNHQTATIMPTQPLVINQMPMLTPGVQFILRPQPKMSAQVQTATATPQGLILQPTGPQLVQIQPPRSQPMVRVLTNGVQLAPPTTTYVTHLATPTVSNTQQITQNVSNTLPSPSKKKPKKKKQILDLANIMKLSGIGDEDDVQFESDTSQSESEHGIAQPQPITPQPTVVHSQPNTVHAHANMIHQGDPNKRLGNIQISAVAQPTINATATPLVQVLNQNFQSGVIPNSPSFQTSQAATAQATIPFNPFITPNFTINNGLMLQRNGGFKLALGEDGRLVLQHDPTLNQDLQSQLLLQSIFGLNGLVLQPSMDQQVHSQTVQTIQQQSVQTIQQQTVQSQTIQTVQQQTVQPQTVQHSLQTIQQTIQPQIQTVQPQTVQQTVQQTIQRSAIQQHAHAQPMQIVQPLSQNIQSQNIHVPQPVHSVQSQVTPSIQSIQSQVHSIQSQIQGQIQSLLQSQPLQTIQAQPVHSQSLSQTIQSHQSVQSHQMVQPILKVPPFQKTPPVQTVHPLQTIHHPPQNLAENRPNQPQAPTSYVVNLTPDQLEQLKRNGQLTVNGQTIFMQRPNKVPEQQQPNNENKNVKLSPKIKPAKKITKVQTSAVKSVLQDNVVVKQVNNIDKIINHVAKDTKSTLISALQSPPKNHVQVQPQPTQQTPVQPKLATPSSSAAPPVQPASQQPKVQVQPIVQQNHENGPDVERILGQLLEPPAAQPPSAVSTSHTQTQPPQQVHTIQLTPQQQQHLKSVQVQIHALSERLTPGDAEMETALKLLFAEQQKILASGKLLPPDKVYYHNNQLTIVNPSTMSAPNVQPKTEPPPLARPNVAVRTMCGESTTTQVVDVQQSPRITITAPSVVEHPVVQHANTINPPVAPQNIGPRLTAPPAPPVITQQPQHKFIPSFTKAQLLEQQLNTDQNGAVKPDIHAPFKDKADACKRLIRYHCFNQPVLSQKDLDKADEIFELTARHFIDKFSRMVDKYRYLLLKESMRQVQTSELMMLDRMFLAEEQQSLIRLRQELEETPPPELLPAVPPSSSDPTQEEYDEWTCIQRELGCLPQDDTKPNVGQPNYQAPKRSASSDSRLETLKRFRVEKHNKKGTDSAHCASGNISVSTHGAQHLSSFGGLTRCASVQGASSSQGTSAAYHSVQSSRTAQFSHMQHHSFQGNHVLQHGVQHVVHLAQQQGAHNAAAHIHGSQHNVQLNSSRSDDNEPENNSIDEQVQSAIDSILNLQQSTPLDLDDAVSSILS